MLSIRPALALVLAVFSNCAFFNPPCTRLAKLVCNLPAEGDVCAFVLDIQRNDADGQSLCEEVLPAAIVYAQDRTDASARADWIQARMGLEREGFRTDPRKGRIDEKLKAAGGTGGRVVQGVEDAFDQGQELLEERLKGIE